MSCPGIKPYTYWFTSYDFLNIFIVEIKICWGLLGVPIKVYPIKKTPPYSIVK